MVLSTHYVQRICNHYNKRQAGGFGRKNSDKKFLAPVGLTLDADPPPFYGENRELLTPQEEFDLFSAMHFVKFKIKKSSPENQALLRLYMALRNRVISANWRLIPACIRKYKGVFVDIDRLYETGHASLISAVDAFDPWRGFKLSTYACSSIIRQFYQRPKKQVSVYDFIDVYTISGKKIDMGEDQVQALWLERLKKHFQIAVQTKLLTEQERNIIIWRFGFGCPVMTLKEVGKKLNYTPEWVRQLQFNALSKLKRLLNKDPILNI